jgi:iron complex outermembrane receptor protein
MRKQGLKIALIAVGSLSGSVVLAQASGPSVQSAGPPAAGPAAPTQGSGAADSGVLEEVVVTGTSIRGVAPIGSNVITVDQAAMQAVGAVSVSQLVNTVPAITTANSAPQGENVFSYYSPQIHSLGGSASNSTLVIMDGLRMPGGGTQYSETDPNIIPTLAIERIEVLADGASSVYGSDAVAGVVNFITRRKYEGLQLNVQGGKASDYHNYSADLLWGTHWGTGSAIIAASYSQQSRLDNISRDFLRMSDYRPLGGSNFNTYTCSPATIKAPAGSSPVYLSPSATMPVANTVDNSPCNISLWGSALPKQTRANALMKITNDFSDRLTTTTTLIVNEQKTNKPSQPGSITNVTVYGPGSGKGGLINPFYVAPAGNPGATSEQVSWLDLLSPSYGRVDSQEDVVYGTFSVDYKLFHDWTANFTDALAWNESSLSSSGVFCAPCAYLALNGTAQVTGNPTTSDITNQNVIALNTPLTAANALDVWNPVGSNLTSPDVAKGLYSANTSNTNLNTFNQAKLALEGPLFALPAGAVRMAVGGEVMSAHLTQNIVGLNNTGPSITGSAERIYRYSRIVRSAYAELEVPVVSPSMNIPLVHALDVDVSGRYDDYNDVGSTRNPKYAFNWTVIKGFKLRANYATSFVAPPLAVIGDPTQGYLYASGSVGLQGQFNVPVANFPEVLGVPGCANATVTCALGLSNNQGLRRQLGGGFDNIQPETGRSWSVGADFAPQFMPGFVANVTLFNNVFSGGVTSPNPNSIVNSAGLHHRLTLCPTGCTAAQIAAFANTANGVTLSSTIPANVYFLLDQNSGNVLNLDIQGIDLELSYVLQTQRLGIFRFGDALTEFLRFRQNFGGGESFSILNTSGYNTTFPSVRTQDRLSLGWTGGALALDAFFNYTGSYRNWSNTAVNPVITNSNGTPIGGGDEVASNLTVDLHAAYSFQMGGFKTLQVYLDGKNVFNRAPPFYNGTTGGILGPGGIPASGGGTPGSYGFNGFVSNPIGRLISLGLRVEL